MKNQIQYTKSQQEAISAAFKLLLDASVEQGAQIQGAQFQMDVVVTLLFESMKSCGTDTKLSLVSSSHFAATAHMTAVQLYTSWIDSLDSEKTDEDQLSLDGLEPTEDDTDGTPG
jgi:hypothetical protein